MSTIPYPHRAKVMRGGDLNPLELDEWSNPVAAEPVEVTEIDCWVQAQSTLRIAVEGVTVAEIGDEGKTHTVFCEVREFDPRDFLVTVSGGGQVGGERHRILSISNPDGGTDHLELSTHLVVRGTA